MSDVTIKGFTWTPTAPVDFSLAFDIMLLSAKNRTRACAAALVATWRSTELERPDVSYAQAEYSAGKFGGDCLNALVEMGITPTEVFREGNKAFAVLADSVIPATEVKDREDFTSPPKGEPNGS